MSSLQEEIEARKQEARDKEIQNKSEKVASHFGERSPADSGSQFVLERDALSIVYTHNYTRHDEAFVESYTLVKYRDELVFQWVGEGGGARSTKSGIQAYVPSEEWEAMLDALHTKALEMEGAMEQKQAEEDAREQSASEAAERTRFGL